MLYVFENTESRPSRHGRNAGQVTPYLNSSVTGLPAEVDDGDQLFDRLASYGTPVPVPDGLVTTNLRRELAQATAAA